MSIEFSLKLKGHQINDDILISEIEKLGCYKNFSIADDIFDIEETYTTIGFSVTCFKKFDPNQEMGYETRFMNNQIFYYDQLLNCNFNKEFDRDVSYAKAINLMFEIMKRVNTKALITNSFFEELCFFQDNENVMINSFVNIWNNIQVYNILRDWNSTILT